MAGSVAFVLAVVLVPLLCGLPLAGRLKKSDRGAQAPDGWALVVAVWLAGVVVAVLAGTLISAVGLGWWGAGAGVVLVAGLGGGFSVVRWWRGSGERVRAAGRRRSIGLVVVAVVVGGLVAAAVAIMAATSVDLAFFWGPKALFFARAGGIDLEMQREPYMMHTHVTYPPAWTFLLAWGAMAAGRMPWMLVPWLSLGGLVMATPLVWRLLERRLGGRAAAVTGLWLVAMAAGLVASLSAGNAAILLLVFETVAVVILVADAGSEARPWSGSGLLAAVALAGAVLTKSEGAVAVVLVLGGVLVRGLVRAERGVVRRVVVLGLPAGCSWLVWLAVRLALGLPFADPIRERALVMSLEHVPEIAKACFWSLGMGTGWLSWLVPLVLVVVCRRSRWMEGLVDVLPALSLSLGLGGFAGVYYLHVQGDVVSMVAWTLPRLALPALSAWIVAAGVLSLGGSAGVKGSGGECQRVQA